MQLRLKGNDMLHAPSIVRSMTEHFRFGGSNEAEAINVIASGWNIPSHKAWLILSQQCETEAQGNDLLVTFPRGQS